MPSTTIDLKTLAQDGRVTELARALEGRDAAAQPGRGAKQGTKDLIRQGMKTGVKVGRKPGFKGGEKMR